MDRLPLSELIALFAGTEWTTAYPTEQLAQLICQRSQPKTLTQARNTIYGPDWPTDSIPDNELKALHTGYTEYKLNQQQKAA